jgi:nucleoside-diphosphate-sugar epimerase
MMYMPDAIRATIELMEAPADRIAVRTSYNISAMSFSPAEVAASIQRKIPSFTLSCQPDYRQVIADSWPQSIDEVIADSWPQSIDDSVARHDWGWTPQYDLDAMTDDMLQHLG